MNELYLIMDAFLQVEYRQKALLSILKALEGYYSEDEQEELKLLVSNGKWVLEGLHEQMKSSISRLDNYVVPAVGKEQYQKAASRKYVSCGCLFLWVFSLDVACPCDIIKGNIVVFGKN